MKVQVEKVVEIYTDGRMFLPVQYTLMCEHAIFIAGQCEKPHDVPKVGDTIDTPDTGGRRWYDR